jgi:FkbM family methyltransferase
MNRLRRSPLLYSGGVAIRDISSLLRGIRNGSFSQHGEDRYIAKYFESRAKGFYLDIGASHPFRISNTYSLYRAGWQGVTVEPIPRLAKLHRRWRRRDELLAVAVGATDGTVDFFEMTPSVLSTLDHAVASQYITEGKAVLYRRYPIKVMAVNEVFEYATTIAPIDFVSIDIEGLDVSVLAAVDFARFRPELICIEVNDSAVRQVATQLFARAQYKVLDQLGCNLMAARMDASN